MRLVLVLPSHLHTAIAHRLRIISSTDADILLLSSDTPQSIPELQPNDGLLIIQCHDFCFAQAMAASAAAMGVRYADIAVHESFFTQHYGFMIAAGGKVEDLQFFAPVLDALAPQANAWWHVGSAGAAAFLSGMLNQFIARQQQNIDFSALFLHLQQQGAQQAYARQLAQHYLTSTEGELFVSAHAQQKPLASFFQGTQSPARQIALMLTHSPSMETTKPCI